MFRGLIFTSLREKSGSKELKWGGMKGFETPQPQIAAEYKLSFKHNNI